MSANKINPMLLIDFTRLYMPKCYLKEYKVRFIFYTEDEPRKEMGQGCNVRTSRLY